MRCSNCALENPPNATKCDCGSGFNAGTQAASQPIQTKVPGSWAAAIIRLAWVCPLFGAMLSGFSLATDWTAQQGAPQQAALAAYVLAWAVIPYCFARAVAGIIGRPQA